jgi:XrtJ-associated TM-motif-TM protein
MTDTRRNTVKKLVYIVPLALLLFAATMPLHAGGKVVCVNSPENPTAVLALIGVAGACITQLRARFRNK